jgi:ribosomal protein S6
MTEEPQIDSIEEGSDESRVYEAAFHVISSVDEAQAAAVAGEIRSLIEAKGGKVIGGEAPLLMPLAYPMQKDIDRKRHTFTSAYFGWIFFEANGDIAHEVKKAIETNISILRSLVVKTTKAAALEPHKHPAHLAPQERPSVSFQEAPVAPIEEKPAEPMTVEAMDAEIAKLVVE